MEEERAESVYFALPFALVFFDTRVFDEMGESPVVQGVRHGFDPPSDALGDFPGFIFLKKGMCVTDAHVDFVIEKERP